MRLALLIGRERFHENDHQFLRSVHALEWRCLNVGRRTRASDEGDLTGRGFSRVGRFDHFFIDGDHPLDRDKDNVDGRGKRKETGLVFAVKEYDGP